MTPLQHRSDALPAGRDFQLKIALLTAGIVTMAFGLLALLGWISGLLWLASFGANMIPMAPSTAVLFLLYGAAIGLRARTPLSRRAFRFSVALAGLGTLAALLLFTLGWLHIQWAGEHLGLNITGTVAGARTGHMSPVTAFYFLLVGVSFLASLSPSATRPWRVGLALVSAGVLLATSFIFLLAYGLDTPLLYGGAFIPPALNTILAFVPLGLALLTLAGRPGGLSRGLPGDDSKPALIFALIFLFLAAGIVAIGYFYFRNYGRQFRAEVEQQLSAIAELKVGELAQYRKERLADATVLHKNPVFSQLARRFLAAPADAEAQRQLQTWLGKYQSHFQYDEVSLLDAQGGGRMSAPESSVPVAAVISARVAEVLRSGQPVFQDFYRHELSQRIYLALLIPIRDEADGNRPLGVLVLRIDPVNYLYPFISRWPVPSATAETLLVRREGNEVVFLNELRFQTNTALTLHFSLANTNLPAAKAALGQEGIVTGIDYRGEPVLAAVRTVPDSPWFLVARRDIAEVYAPLRAQLWQVIAMICFLLFGAGGGVMLVWRQQRVRFYKDQAQSAVALQESQALLESINQSTSDAIYLKDTQGRYLVFNAAASRFVGKPSEAVLGKDDTILFPPDQARKVMAGDRQVMMSGCTQTYEELVTTSAGLTTFLTTKGQVRDAQGEIIGLFGIARDITERKRAEAERQKFAMLADSSSEFIGLCDLDMKPLYVNPAGLRLVGLPDIAAAYQVKVQDYFFPEDQRFIAEEFFPRVLREGHGDVEIRLRHFQTGEPIWMFYYLFSVRDASGGIVGWATVSRDITERRQAEEALRQSRRAALNLMTDAVEARDRAEQMSQALLASEENYRMLFHEMLNGFALHEIICDEAGNPSDYRFLAINPAFERMTGLKAAETVGRTVSEILPDTERSWIEHYGKVALTGEPLYFENYAASMKKHFEVAAFRPKLKQIACVFSDITERRLAVAEVRRLNEDLEQRVQERTAELLAANQELSAFAYAVSHDLRQPLRAINGFGQALVEDCGAMLPDAAHEHLDEIILASRRMGELIDGLLRLSRSTRGELQRDTVDLSAQASRILGELAAAEPERRVTWTVAPGLTAWGDERMIEVVLANLLGNAWKYTAKTPQPTIRVYGQHTGDDQQFCVADNGAGFDMRHAARLFQPFQRLHREDEFSGIGIGLATVQRIVQRHGGAIQATAAPGQGATFSFILSAADSSNREP